MRAFFTLCLSLFFLGPAFSDMPAPREFELSDECFGGEIVSHPITIKGEGVAKVSANKECWDSNPDSANRHKEAPGGVDFLLCLPDLGVCQEENDKHDVAYMTFLIPPDEFVTKLASLYEEKYFLVNSSGGVNLYTDSDKRREIYVSKAGSIFNVRCFKSEHGSCEMMGLADGGIQYFLNFHYQEQNIDWRSLHKNIVGFIENTARFE
ncbi:hypothetical protein MA04_00692 [Alcanivorax balearicus MACL04]|uniref:Uncharacterized protein n=1 Tax=Alloalcanivorax balearicus MACL04 TaxID=1177182 RepID=A0ABT2QV44_9GAMM|nr:hypothetical protein [Alloalcanivorax balearicus]MCU5781392.1 hypothetical protein [Alloalcanivorax balearicus MACL04]